MIRSFKDNAAAACLRAERVFGVGWEQVQRVARRKLLMLDAATSLRDLARPPNNRLEALRHNRAGQHAMRVNDQWRVCFVWRDDGAHAVEIADYHQEGRRMNPDLMIHPGEILLEEFIRPHGLTPSGLADRLGLPANRITAIVNGERGLSPETAVLLAAAFGTSDAFWINLQTRYDLEQARAGISAERMAKAEALRQELEKA